MGFTKRRLEHDIEVDKRLDAIEAQLEKKGGDPGFDLDEFLKPFVVEVSTKETVSGDLTTEDVTHEEYLRILSKEH